MVVPEHPYGLIGDQLHRVIKDYVATQIPSSETLVGEMFESTAFLVERLAASDVPAPLLAFRDRECRIVSLTNQNLRVHALDQGYGLSQKGYQYYDKAFKVGRYSRRGYDTLLDRMGMRSYHIPNQVAEFRLSVADIADVQLCPQEASRSNIDSVWQNYQEKISHLVTLKFSDEYRQFQIETFYVGIVSFHEQLFQMLSSQ
jgi:hypothetical protein